MRKKNNEKTREIEREKERMEKRHMNDYPI